MNELEGEALVAINQCHPTASVTWCQRALTYNVTRFGMIRERNGSTGNRSKRSLNMKGIVLAGGHGTRLHPATLAISKQLLPIYDKPMVYYPLSILMLAEIREILIISTPRDLPHFQALLGDGSQFGLTLHYAEQSEPRGIAHALIVAEGFLAGDSVFLALGDNVLYGNHFAEILHHALTVRWGARIFAYRVGDPQHFGVIEFDEQGRAIRLDEKPTQPRSNWAVVGLYAYGPQVVDDVKTLKPSARGELEITDLNRLYLERGELGVRLLGRGVAWLDTGTPLAMSEASIFIRTLEARQGLKVACLEEIAYHQGWITPAQMQAQIDRLGDNSYGQYLRRVLDEGRP